MVTNVDKEIEAAMAISDFFARKALEGVGSPTDALHAIRETLKPFIKPLRDEDVAIVGEEIVPRGPNGDGSS